MNKPRPSEYNPAQSLPVYRSADFVVVDGSNLDDPLSFAAELLLDHVYELGYTAEPKRLALHALSATKFTVASDSEIGSAGAAIYLDSALTLMSPDGKITDAMVLVEVDAAGDINDIYLLPLGPLSPRICYSLVGINTQTPANVFAQVACVSFLRGTHITLASANSAPLKCCALVTVF